MDTNYVSSFRNPRIVRCLTLRNMFTCCGRCADCCEVIGFPQRHQGRAQGQPRCYWLIWLLIVLVLIFTIGYGISILFKPKTTSIAPPVPVPVSINQTLPPENVSLIKQQQIVAPLISTSRSKIQPIIINKTQSIVEPISQIQHPNERPVLQNKIIQPIVSTNVYKPKPSKTYIQVQPIQQKPSREIIPKQRHPQIVHVIKQKKVKTRQPIKHPQLVKTKVISQNPVIKKQKHPLKEQIKQTKQTKQTKQINIIQKVIEKPKHKIQKIKDVQRNKTKPSSIPIIIPLIIIPIPIPIGIPIVNPISKQQMKISRHKSQKIQYFQNTSYKLKHKYKHRKQNKSNTQNITYPLNNQQQISYTSPINKIQSNIQQNKNKNRQVQFQLNNTKSTSDINNKSKSTNTKLEKTKRVIQKISYVSNIRHIRKNYKKHIIKKAFKYLKNKQSNTQIQ